VLGLRAAICGASELTMGDWRDRKNQAGKETPPKIKAEDNPWYLLAMLYGVPESKNPELFANNRRAWNRYFAVNLDKEMRTQLIEQKRYAEEELPRSLPMEEVQRIRDEFAGRCAALGSNVELPDPRSPIDFTNVQFDCNVSFDKYLFHKSFFRDASFERQANFSGATFFGVAVFEGATFSSSVVFEGTAFTFGAIFTRVTFSQLTGFGGTTFSNNTSFFSTTFGGFTSFERAVFYDERDMGRAIKTTFDSATFKETARVQTYFNQK
jgi:hypothetical protein